MTDQPALFTSHPTQAGIRYVFHALARNTDPDTSHKAARSVRPRSGSQRIKLLRQYSIHGALTAWEAGQASGLASKPGCAYWRRVTELLHEELIEDTGEVRLVATGEYQRVCAITYKGNQLVLELAC